MDMVALPTLARPSKVSPRNLRREGKVPCVVYGNEVKNTTLCCEYNQLFKVYVKAGESTLVELDMAGKKIPALIHTIDFEPVSGRISHVDFYAVNMKKEIEARVPVRLTGISPAVRDEGGVIVTVYDHLTVRCLPGDLPHDIEIPIDGLLKFNDSILVSQVKIPKGVTVKETHDTLVVTVQEPRKEEVIVPVAAEVPAEGEAAAGAVPAEGEAAAPGAKPAAAGAKPAAPAKPGKKE